eukprot:TRINITY_DN11932_c0_g1_i3.p1 TRINITY_DN11932_c0_g1~~TRINITY_DN11932_c0_g1_i3.p1  ORF type:complete len:114 (-),score=10.89 TRINITY_DN11932_c0_g1_i3:38-379(-)
MIQRRKFRVVDNNWVIFVNRAGKTNIRSIEDMCLESMVLFFYGVKLAGMLKSLTIICCGCVGIVDESFAVIETYSTDGRYTVINRNSMFKETSGILLKKTILLVSSMLFFPKF